ncbi:MAG TPA: cytochrome c biogenesis protein [Myxococcota bacterium]|nr:cytochrome c biogenesis protein [Myxococcota bacterium]
MADTRIADTDRDRDRASPPRQRPALGVLIRASGAALLLSTALWAYFVYAAPLDHVQGRIQKILYVHVPCWFAAYAGFALTAVCGALYLWKNDERFDRAAVAGAEVGVLFCTLGLVTGPIWAKGTWGHWWAWDPRLTLTLVLWFIYLSYLLLRSFTEGSARTARFAAVYGIAGLAAVPLNYFAIELFGGAAMHPDNLARGSLGAGMGMPFAWGVVSGLLAFAHLVAQRIALESERRDSSWAVARGSGAERV